MSDLGIQERRVHRRDVPWIGASVTTLCGPLPMPSVQELEDAIAALSRRYPHSRLGWGLDNLRRRWLVPGERGSADNGAIVVERSRGGHDTIGETLDAMLHDRSVDAPLTVFRYEQHFGLRMSHELGDGRFYDEAIGAVMLAAAPDGQASWNIGPTTRYPLTSAVLRTFGSNPRRLLAAVADRPDRHPTPQSPETVPWTPSRRTVSAVLPAGRKAQIVAWGRDNAAGTSWFALLVSGLLRGLQCAGLPVASDVSVVMDLRRYLKSADLDGNFVVGVPFNISYQTPPEAVAAMIRAAVQSGRPVAAEVHSALRPWRRGKPIGEVDSAGTPRVTFTSVGTPPRINSMPFLAGHLATCAGSVEPEGPLGLTFLISETPDASVVTASFHDNVIDAGSVERALALVESSPVEVMSRW